MVETIFTHPVFVETVLPFLLMFTLIFAVLQKTKILGEGKRQIDAIVALAIALIFVSFGRATDIVVRMIPVLGIALVVILIFMILLGSVYSPGSFEMKGWMKVVVGLLAALVVAGTVLILTGGLDYVVSFIYSGGNVGILVNLVLIAIIIGAIAAVVLGGGKDKDGKGKDK